MIRYGLLLTGVVALSWVWWAVGRQSALEPARREPSQAERIIEYCSVTINRNSPLCRVPDPTDTAQVEDAVREVVRDSPRVIERETVREGDDDDDSETIIVTPRQTSQPRPSSPTVPRPTQAPTTRPPLLPDVEIPDVPNLQEPPRVIPDLPIVRP